MGLLSPVVSRRGFLVLGTVAAALAHVGTAQPQPASAAAAAGAPVRPHVTLLGVL